MGLFSRLGHLAEEELPKIGKSVRFFNNNAWEPEAPVISHMLGATQINLVGEHFPREAEESVLHHYAKLAERYPSVARNIHEVNVVNTPGFYAHPWEGEAGPLQLISRAGSNALDVSRPHIDINLPKIARIGETSGQFTVTRKTGLYEGVQDVLTHEFGHHVDFSMGAQVIPHPAPAWGASGHVMGLSSPAAWQHATREVLGRPMQAGLENQMDTMLHYNKEIMERVSPYGALDPMEFFAETFSLAHRSGSDMGRFRSGIQRSSRFRSGLGVATAHVDAQGAVSRTFNTARGGSYKDIEHRLIERTAKGATIRNGKAIPVIRS